MSCTTRAACSDRINWHRGRLRRTPLDNHQIDLDGVLEGDDLGVERLAALERLADAQVTEDRPLHTAVAERVSELRRTPRPRVDVVQIRPADRHHEPRMAILASTTAYKWARR